MKSVIKRLIILHCDPGEPGSLRGFESLIVVLRVNPGCVMWGRRYCSIVRKYLSLHKQLSVTQHIRLNKVAFWYKLKIFEQLVNFSHIFLTAFILLLKFAIQFGHWIIMLIFCLLTFTVLMHSLGQNHVSCLKYLLNYLFYMLSKWKLAAGIFVG